MTPHLSGPTANYRNLTTLLTDWMNNLESGLRLPFYLRDTQPTVEDMQVLAAWTNMNHKFLVQAQQIPFLGQNHTTCGIQLRTNSGVLCAVFIVNRLKQRWDFSHFYCPSHGPAHPNNFAVENDDLLEAVLIDLERAGMIPSEFVPIGEK